MSNGMEELSDILKDSDLPQTVTNRLLLAEIRGLRLDIQKASETINKNRSDIDKLIDQVSPATFGTFAWLREKAAAPAIAAAVAVLLSSVLQ